MNRYAIGDQVIVTHERGREIGVVTGFTKPNFQLINVRFSDGTNSTWWSEQVAPFKGDAQ
jgi:hypothetical protein